MRIRKPNLRPIPADLKEDYFMFSGRHLYRANKSTWWKNGIVELITTFDKFLADHNLYVDGGRKSPIPEEYEIRRNQLTEEGFEFLWRYLTGYLTHLDTTNRHSNIEYLDKCWEHFKPNKMLKRTG